MNYFEQANAVLLEVNKVVEGKADVVKKAFAAILASGHILIEDVPGVGKTTLAKAFSEAMALNNNRVQFTPDVMPSDILGFNMYNKEKGNFYYYPGAIMCNLFLADEINRTSPKTQSALLEVMEENKVTIDTESKPVPNPFIVIATQNPKGSAGTQLLPESQLDRFMICISMGYPNLAAEIEIAKGKSKKDTEKINQVVDANGLVNIINEVEEIYVHNSIYTYVAKLVQATRENPYIDLGVSPRGTIALVRLAKAWSYLDNRHFVTPKDVEDVFIDVAKHRIVLNTKAKISKVSPANVLREIIAAVPAPTSRKERKGNDN